MITVAWTLADGTRGEKTLVGDDKWVLGRSTADGGAVDVSLDDQGVSRAALVIRDSGPGPVAFRGQRENGARVGVESVSGDVTWLDEGTAQSLTAEARRVLFVLGDQTAATIDVTFDQRGTVVERQQAAEVVNYDA